MNSKEILEVCNLRLNHFSWEQVAKKMHYSENHLKNEIKKWILDEDGKGGAGKYPNIRRWMRMNRIKVADLARASGYTKNYIILVLNQHYSMPKPLIRTICDLSGMSEEQALEYDEKEKSPPTP